MHPKAISEEVGLPLDRVRAALLELEAEDAESRSSESGGRRIIRMDEHRDWGWKIVNYVKYRSIKNEDDRREQNKLAQEKWRNKNKHDVSSVSSVSRDKPMQKEKEKEKEKEIQREGEGEARKRATPMLRPEDVSEQIWLDWIALRKAKRATASSTVITEARVEAEKAGLTLERFLAVWCARGSQGLMADWLKPNERAGAPAQPNKQIALEERNRKVAEEWVANRRKHINDEAVQE